MNKAAISLKGKFIVSCQAYDDSPIFGAENMTRMAQCAIKGGAGGIRACWPDQIRSIRSITELPIIGINKRKDVRNIDILTQVFITPTYESAASIIAAGCNIVALDGTLRGRTYDQLSALVARLKNDFPQVGLMADLSTIEEGLNCARMGFDILSSTLSGYTYYTKDKSNAPDIELVRRLKVETDCLVNAEGRIWETGELKMVLDAGADMVTIGSAITNPIKATERFAKLINAKAACHTAR